VGDIAVAESVPTFSSIDLGTNQRIPRLLLRDAPAREVLALLARAANMNLVYVPAQPTEGTQGQGTPSQPSQGTPSQPSQGTPSQPSQGQNQGTPSQQNQNQNSQLSASGSPLISLDIENESIQDVFNHVLRVTGLQANRVGRSIYVGSALPVSAQTITIRTLRLNQMAAENAAQFLIALGATGNVVTATQPTPISAVSLTTEGQQDVASKLSETQQETRDSQTSSNQQPSQSGNSSQAQNDRGSQTSNPRILNGLSVVADARTNSVTLTGRPDLIAIATEQLSRVDLRKRQVAINVRVIDVNLSAIDQFNTSFGFSIGNVDISSSNGLSINVPSLNSEQGFFLDLLAQVENGNAKILTDPTLIIQEGQSATVGLTTQVVQKIVVTNSNTSGGVDRETRNPVLVDAGLVLGINIDRIDDNGFITLSVAPSISAPVAQVETDDIGGFVTLLSQRILQSGQIRVRDEQTLLLSGIIQESERSTVTKVPILGDIPILGALFRSTKTDNQRQELIVLLTPRILDDSDQSVFGYSYTPSDQMQEVLDQGSR
jgi:type IV pilus assembly protein PilQ